ncbi:Wings apart-like protein-like [Acipenser ruthenus]|uniref:Wings apart-like protein homolog n=1 Tax=Acipenser ruthenus TaxID=7906 RepID=A0A444UKX2_ACIRT|nr:wings apart-like protein homolog [Acipenser ruthenus]RXM35825.1 Wings apart-like protein-like [Acipenser ruthenus]
MTSRFGKTYSRKGGNGSSKFDEVVSNKRATLSTKWGETTFKAQVGSKRPNFKPEVTEVPKRVKYTEPETSEDPFGFDSDEDSKPVTSRSIAQTKAPSGKQATETVTSENFTSVLEANSMISQPISKDAVATGRVSAFDAAVHGIKEKSTNKIPEEGNSVFSSYTTAEKTPQNWSNESTEKNSYSWYKNATESDKKPSAQTTTLKMDTKDSFDSWQSSAGFRSDSPNSETSKSKESTWTGSTKQGTEANYESKVEESASHLDSDFSLKSQSDQAGGGGIDIPMEPAEAEVVSQSVLRPSNCRTYRRPNKGKQSSPVDNSDKLADSTGQSSAKTNSVAVKPANTGRGRTRDYTVLHPSCLSVCNVTIQDTTERSIDEFTTAAPADLGEAGRLRKKTEIAAAARPARFRPTQNKSKKAAKLEFFGFDEEHGGQGIEGDPTASGSANYKIKYFGFDDVSESDSDEEEGSQASEKRKAKKKKAAAPAAASTATAASMTSSSLQLSCMGESDSQDSQTSTNTDILDFQDDSFPTVSEVTRRPANQQSDKAKESTRKIFSGPKRSPTKAVYNARHWNRPEPEELPPPPLSRFHTAPASISTKETTAHKDDGLFKAPPPPPRVIKSVTMPTQPYQYIVTALKCRKEDKELYTVVQHVKHFNDVVEFGENQEFTDDFEYLQTGLKSSQPLNTRCLSIISLASKCAMPSFRMHLRAHGMVAQVFKTLNDAPQHPNLALCTASLMYILSRDRLNMDLDRASLDLMIRLLELEQDSSVAIQLNEKEINKVKEKIRKLCETVHNKHLDLENITSGHLAMETLLSLTSKRAGDWFKEELRLLGGLDHIVDKVKECVENLSHEDDEENLVASLRGAERCLRVLESVTVHNPENQSYLIAYKDSQLIVSSARGLWHCEEMIQRYNHVANSLASADGKSLPHRSSSGNVGKAVEDCMRAIIGVLLNLTHDNEWGSTKTGEQDSFIITALHCVLRVPQYLAQEQRFDIRVLGLGLLINLVEYSARNRHCLVEMEMDCEPFETICIAEGEELKTEGSMSAIAALVQLFLQRERAAVLAETETDDFINDAPKPQLDQSGEWQETSGEIQWVASENHTNSNTNEKEKKEEEDEELDLNKALQHAGKHMEDCIVASYTALLLGCLCQGSPMNVTTVREILPKGDFSIMTEMLKKFLNFMNLTCAVGTTGQKSISRVIDYLEHC